MPKAGNSLNKLNIDKGPFSFSTRKHLIELDELGPRETIYEISVQRGKKTKGRRLLKELRYQVIQLSYRGYTLNKGGLLGSSYNSRVTLNAPCFMQRQ